MKQYGFNKTTEFTRKQIGAIYMAAKNGELKVEKWVMNDFYDLADYYGYDSNKTVERAELEILKIIDVVFKRNIGEAQVLINKYTKSYFMLMSRKNREKADRTIV